MGMRTNFRHRDVAVGLPIGIELPIGTVGIDASSVAASFIFLQVTPSYTITTILTEVMQRIRFHDNDAIRTIYYEREGCIGIINSINLDITPNIKNFILDDTTITSITFVGTYVRRINNDTQLGCCTMRATKTGTQFNTALVQKWQPVLQLQSFLSS